jgi:hypothetical protein
MCASRPPSISVPYRNTGLAIMRQPCPIVSGSMPCATMVSIIASAPSAVVANQPGAQRAVPFLPVQ